MIFCDPFKIAVFEMTLENLYLGIPTQFLFRFTAWLQWILYGFVETQGEISWKMLPF